MYFHTQDKQEASTFHSADATGKESEKLLVRRCLELRVVFLFDHTDKSFTKTVSCNRLPQKHASQSTVCQ